MKRVINDVLPTVGKVLAAFVGRGKVRRVYMYRFVHPERPAW
jgi:hypothetical protein